MNINSDFNSMEAIINNTGALIYVIDLETYEIIYANNKCKEQFGDIINKVCYKVLQKNQNSPCAFCPVQQTDNHLSQSIGAVFEWENKNSINGRSYLFNTKIMHWNEKKKVKIQIGIDITLQKELEEKNLKLANFDTLTNIPNRSLIKKFIQNAIKISSRNNSYFSLLFIDLDNFKIINDTKGHDIGDFALIETIDRIKKILRENDRIGRLGGDEFIILADTSTSNESVAIEAVRSIAQKILKELNRPYIINEYTFFISASIGIVMFNESKHSDIELIKYADSAMYMAKQNGKNNFYFFDTVLQKNIEHKTKTIKEIKNALKNEEFVLYYQPQISLNKDQNIIGVEALIRWQNPKKGIVLPAYFIPVAKDSGLIIEIEKLVLKKAFKQLNEWKKDKIKKDWRLSIEISIKQLTTTNFFADIKKMFNEYDINPKLLRLQLSEKFISKDIKNILEKIEDLNKIGLSFSIDNFESSCLSLSYLKTLPIDELKISESLIYSMHEDINSKTMIQTILFIGKEFGFEVIAKGVKTEQEQNKLLTMGCTIFQQSYLISA
ncbi:MULTISPECIES: EAL domain-containing protein [unclassified Sulfurimonas]|uniref:putative bifunctional diguanylate cyclase/phosphodiesterase n=1 Tax=unclassified Sulfurimonas TaxID=2623549 RepID=UPI000A7C8E69|nr:MULTISPECIES: EAL domain-containing protein [unclassified Sulfurimonas]